MNRKLGHQGVQSIIVDMTKQCYVATEEPKPLGWAYGVLAVVTAFELACMVARPVCAWLHMPMF